MLMPKDELLWLGAFRYALGRRTYIVSETVETILTYWDEIPKKIQKTIIKEIQEKSDLGDESDEKQWKKILQEKSDKG